MQTGFDGFPREALQFFRALEKNNRREWFQPRREVFERQVREPMIQLVNALNGALARSAPDYITEPKQAIFRIYRDTRFSADKSPYKTHIAATFSCRRLEGHAGAGLYFSVNHKEIEVAGGLYMPRPEQLLAVRSHLADHHAEFRKILSQKALRNLLSELWGDQLSRMPKGFAADHPAADLIKYKQWVVFATLEPRLAATPRLFSEIARRFEAMIPLVECLNTALKARRRPLGSFLSGG